MKTLDELKLAKSTLPARFAQAYQADDQKALAALALEAATIDTQMLFAEKAENEAELAELEEEIAASVVATREDRQTAVEWMDKIKAAERGLELHQRDAGHRKNRGEFAKTRKLQLEKRNAEIDAQIKRNVTVESLPAQRNLVGHIPGPARWPA